MSVVNQSPAPQPVRIRILGTRPAVGGGVVRDVLAGRVPVVLRSELYATPALVGASVAVVGLGRDYLTSYVRNVHAVTPEDVRRVAATHLDDERMTIVVAGDVVQIRDQLTPFGPIEEPVSPPLRVE